MESVVFDGKPFVIPNESIYSAKYIFREIFRDRIYEYESVQVKPNDVVIDVGGNVGFFTTYCIDKGASKVITFEPDPVCSRVLRHNLGIHNIANRCSLVTKGAWSKQEDKQFVSFRKRKGSSHIKQQEEQLAHEFDVVNISCTTIDNIVDKLRPTKVDFIKMDIEGSEMEALKGAIKTIRTFRPKLAISAYHKESDRYDIPEFIRSLGMNYNCHLNNSPGGYNETIAMFS